MRACRSRLFESIFICLLAFVLLGKRREFGVDLHRCLAEGKKVVLTLEHEVLGAQLDKRSKLGGALRAAMHSDGAESGLGHIERPIACGNFFAQHFDVAEDEGYGTCRLRQRCRVADIWRLEKHSDNALHRERLAVQELGKDKPIDLLQPLLCLRRILILDIQSLSPCFAAIAATSPKR